jgi:hypothetical protein
MLLRMPKTSWPRFGYVVPTQKKIARTIWVKNMTKIVNIQGNPYTTATQDMRLVELKKEFHRRVMGAINHAFQIRRPGDTLRVDLQEASELLDQAYYMGREDG